MSKQHRSDSAKQRGSRVLRLIEIAHGRSGDKGDTVNIGIIARAPKYYPVILEQITEAKVQELFRELCHGGVTRYELPNLCAVNFVLKKALDGGGTISLRSDAQGKTLAAALLRIEVRI